MTETEPRYLIMVPVSDESGLEALLAVAVRLARARGGSVQPVYVSSDGVSPSWLAIPSEVEDVVRPSHLIESGNVSRALLTYIRQIEPDLLILRWRHSAGRGSYMLGPTLDPLLQAAPCDVAVLRVTEDAEAFLSRMQSLERLLVPAGGGPNAMVAMEIALDMDADARVTALRIANPNLGPAAISAQWEILRHQVRPWSEQSRLEPHIALTSSVTEGILDEAEDGYDLLLIGATRESVVDRLVFGNLPQNVATNASIPVLIVRKQDPAAMAVLRKLRWRLLGTLPQLPIEERIEVYRNVRAGARTSRDFYVLILMSAAIASLGLLLNSTAVIIGAMLVAPLMTALIGISLGIVQGDGLLVRIALRTTLMGALGAVLVSAVAGLVVPGTAVTSEMASRARPNLLDLGIALGAGVVATYAMARREVANALPGVAIAVALVPPLATAGLALSSSEPRIASGALLLFATNLVAIVAAGAATFLWMGFRPNVAQRERRRVFHSGLLGIGALLLSVTLVLATLSITSIRFGLVERAITEQLSTYDEAMGQQVTITEWDIREIDRRHAVLALRLEAARAIRQYEVARLERELAERLDRPVRIVVTVTQVERIESGTGSPAPF